MRRTEERPQEGFTLIELMVVVLIIAVLLAVAVPTFLGVRNRADDRAAQSDLRIAHTNEMVWLADDTSGFTDDLLELRELDASIDWTDDFADVVSRPGSVYVRLATVAGSDAVVLGTRSRPSTCFWIRAVATAQAPLFAANDCTAVPSDHDFTTSWP